MKPSVGAALIAVDSRARGLGGGGGSPRPRPLPAAPAGPAGAAGRGGGGGGAANAAINGARSASDDHRDSEIVSAPAVAAPAFAEASAGRRVMVARRLSAFSAASVVSAFRRTSRVRLEPDTTRPADAETRTIATATAMRIWQQDAVIDSYP